jgi:transposase
MCRMDNSYSLIMEELQKENRELRVEVSRLRDKLEEKESIINEQKEEINELKEENQKLRQEIFGFKSSKKRRRSSHTSQKPKKRGPPFGHKGTSRKRPDRVDTTIVLELEECPYCGGALKELEDVRERYEEEIIPVPLFVIKYIIKQGYCGNCDRIVYPEVPETIGNRHFGVHFLLYITYLGYVMNLPENKIVTLLNDTYDAHVSIGTVVDYLKKAAELFGDEYERIKKKMRESRICNYDDTGQRVDGKNKWLWAFVSKEVVLYLTSKNHGKKVVIKVLGEDYDGVSTQDFYPSFDSAPGRKQKCWAHLLDDARGLVEKKQPPPESLEFYEGLLQIYKDVKEAVKGLETEEERSGVYAEFVERLESFATQEGKWGHHALKTLAKRVLKYSHELFTFILVPGVEPTNNVAERALRPGVRQRKIWGCLRTEEGAKNRDVMMSVIGTTKIQKKDFFTDGKEYILSKLS